MSFEDQLATLRDGHLKSRIRMASVVAAIQIAGESPTGINASRYAKRQELAYKVIKTAGLGFPAHGTEPAENIADMFVWAVCQNAAITPQSNDGDIQFTINSVWDDCAGVTGDELA